MENYAGIDVPLESAGVSVMDTAGRRERKAGKHEMWSKTYAGTGPLYPLPLDCFVALLLAMTL
jgi:hypothetical protein